ncbi:hypothetical protein FIU87_17745 [Bacillus sp. THAF10]|uniref:hypothetical protein n=1 Tax=Bacillus sp. THAF10 TaxID=2587848 RepID=UPI001268411C|nr:hypothetical protein [Bacillus sp. THAF10]QFT90489.1 hypothetical protein FIU87_17745 [Bacillus sp. THAF10]
MVKEILEMFLKRAMAKSHLMEILPYYNVCCCLIVDGEKFIFSVTKNQLQLEIKPVSIDVSIEGSREEVVKMLNGTKMRDLKSLQFKGSFRQYLLMDSLFTLVNKPVQKGVS